MGRQPAKTKSDSSQVGSKPFSCSICKKRFATRRSENNHMLVVHQNAGRFRCGECKKSFQKNIELEIHSRIHTGEKPFGCEICPSRFKCKGELTAHQLRCHLEKKFKCTQCDAAFGLEWGLKEHLVVHAEEKPFECPVCQKKFSSSTYRKQHMLVIHENAGHLKCKFCHKSFENRQMLENHERVHTGEKPFHCAFCQKQFNRDHHLKNHILDKHSEKKFKCEVCGKLFGREANLKDHVAVVHSEAKTFRCQLCPKQFARKSYLTEHHRDYHSEKKFNCTHCEKRFGRETTLKKHLVTHSKEKPFKCKDCPKAFGSKNLLGKHFLDLHAEKKLKCEEPTCGKRFATNGRLQVHLRTHLNKRFRCDECGSPYKNEQNLKNHLKRSRTCGPNSVQSKLQMESGVEVEQVDGEDSSIGSDGAPYSLRVRRNTPNYRIGKEDFSESDEEPDENSLFGSSESGNDSEPNESDEESDQKDEENSSEDEAEDETEDEAEDDVLHEEKQNNDQVAGNEMCAKRVKTEPTVGEVQVFDVPARSGQRGIKRERDCQTEDEQSGGSKEPKAQKIPDGNISVKTETTAFDCYDFNDLVKNNQSRMKEEPGTRSDGHSQMHAPDQGGEQPSGTVSNLKLVFDLEYRTPD